MEEQIENIRIKQLARIKSRYHLARSFGFNSYESNAMAQWSVKRITAAYGQRMDKITQENM